MWMDGTSGRTDGIDLSGGDARGWGARTRMTGRAYVVSIGARGRTRRAARHTGTAPRAGLHAWAEAGERWWTCGAARARSRGPRGLRAARAVSSRARARSVR